MSDRFYCPEGPVNGQIKLDGDEGRHLALARRLKPGQVVEVFDGRGTAYRASIVSTAKSGVTLNVVGDPLTEPAPSCRLTLASAVPKGDRFDWLVEKATELGVSRLVPLRAERSVVDPRAGKLDRLRRVVVEASKQCGRSRLMDLAELTPWSDFLGQDASCVRLIAHPGGIVPSSWPQIPVGERAVLAIGPEGGFTNLEVNAAVAKGWTPISLGPTILRVETAALAGSALVLGSSWSESAASPLDQTH
ncbi:MAG: RsmE family RNA methyltransferase [Isosphaeraceae bacterium]